MELENHCLFCLEQIVPYSVVSTVSNGEDAGAGGGIRGDVGVGEKLPPLDFQSLCKYLEISLPKKENTESVLSLSCDELLCLSCFEMVDKLNKLQMELAEVRKRIVETSGRIRGVILTHDISADLSSSSNVMRKLELGKKVGSCGIGRSRDSDYLGFVKMFQAMVKGNGIGQDSVKELNVNEQQRNEIASDSDKLVNENNVEVDEMQMKIELDEEHLDNWEGDPKLDANYPYHSDDSDTMMGSQMGNEIDCHPFDTSTLESENEDEEMKPDIMKQPTGQIKNKKRQWQSPSETTSISCRTRKRLRETSPEPSIKPSPMKEHELIPQFKCSECDLSFTSHSQRARHRRETHPRKLSTLQSLIASIPQVPRSKARNRSRNNDHRTYICTICGKHVKEKSSYRLIKYKEHMLSHEEQSSSEATGPYSCTECKKQFNLKINLDLHVVCLHDARLQGVRCNLCPVYTSYESRKELNEHLKSTHGDTVHSCKHCPASRVSFEKLLVHMVKHKKSKKFMCPEAQCVAVCPSIKELHEHCFQAHPQLKQTYKCELCDKVYLQGDAFLIHMQMQHGFDRKSNTFKEEASKTNLTCLQCKSMGKLRVYKTESALRIHITYSHEREKTHKCEQCKDKFFRSKSDLRKHVTIVHENFLHLCAHCGNGYKSTSALKDHLNVHTGEGLVICELCSKEYRSMKMLKNHMRRVHATEESKNTKPVFCEECGKEFRGEESLKRHKYRVHQNEKRVLPKCPICDKTIRQAGNLNTHIKRHSGQKPFKCPICKKCLTEKSVLKTHLKGVHRMEAAAAEETLKNVIAQEDS